ncbi:MAG: DUF3179 domain-containing protein [Candidatus Hydrothermarchaeales archaeon]
MKLKDVILPTRLLIIAAILLAVFALASYITPPAHMIENINASGTYVRGCPEKDCFPSIDDPKFVTVEEGNEMWSDDDEVIGIVYRGIAKAYPLKIVNYHHIVNDEFGGEPIAITRCALCDTSIAYERTIDGRETEFGVLGTLLNSCLVMYDRNTDTSWTQIGGVAFDGELAGEKLRPIEMEHVTWGHWKNRHPNTLILSKDTGFFKSYEFDIVKISGYTTNEEIHFPIAKNDTRLHPKARVFGIEMDGKFRAYPEAEIAKVGILNDRFAGRDILVVQDPESKLIRVFERRLNGWVLNFELKDGRLLDKETESQWNFEGESTSGTNSGKRLNKVDALEIYWFAWAAYHPETELFLAM